MREASGMNSISIQPYEPADITVYLQDKGLVLKEKSLVAFDPVSGKIAAMGSQAEQMTQVGSILVRSPLRQGIIADYEAAVPLFTYVLRKALGRKPIRKPAVVVCMPEGMTNVERRALEEVIRMAGAGHLMISELPAQQLMRLLPQQNPDLSRKFKMFIGIEKDEPERYIAEQLSITINHARQMGIPKEQVAKLLESAESFHHDRKSFFSNTDGFGL